MTASDTSQASRSATRRVWRWGRNVRLHAALKRFAGVSAFVAGLAFLLTQLFAQHAARVTPARAQGELAAALDAAAGELDAAFDNIAGNLQLARDWVQSGAAPPADDAVLNRLFLPLLSRTPVLRSVRIATGSGSEWMLAREDAGWLSRRILSGNGPRTAAWFRWDRSGAPLAREDRGETVYDPRGTSWYRGALAQYRAWNNSAAPGEPNAHWTLPEDGPLRRFTAAVAARDGNDAVVVCLETETLVLKNENAWFAALPESAPGMEGPAWGGARFASATSGVPWPMPYGSAHLWCMKRTHPIAPALDIVLAARVPESVLQAPEVRLQRATLYCAPAAVLLLCALLWLFNRWKARQGVLVFAGGQSPVLTHEGTVLLPSPQPAPPQAFIQALDTTRKQSRRLKAALDALQHEQQAQDLRRRGIFERMEKQRAVLHTLDAAPPGLPGLERIAEAAAALLGVSWCGIWSANPAVSELRCLARYAPAAQRYDSGALLRRDQHLLFFLALEALPLLAIRDAVNDPRLEDVTGARGMHPESRNQPGACAITALLAAPVSQDGRLLGAICFEHTGPARQWAPDEESFAQTLALLLARRLGIAPPGM